MLPAHACHGLGRYVPTGPEPPAILANIARGLPGRRPARAASAACHASRTMNISTSRVSAPSRPAWRSVTLAALLFVAPLAALAQSSAAAGDGGDAAAALQAKYRSLQPQLQRNAFDRPLALTSNEASAGLSGDIYAVVEHPIADVRRAMESPAVWCEVLMLHLNTKYCAVRDAEAGAADGRTAALNVAVGRKFDQPLKDAQRLDFGYRVAATRADYLDVRLSAASGPMSTRDYRIALEAVPVDGGKTFIHLGYSYGYGTAARLAMKSYLATIGSDKVGFTTTGQGGQGGGEFIGGVRGVVERNTMRYYLAIDAYLDAPGPQGREKRLGDWFDDTERYARQLHEMDRDDYLAMKRNEFQRLQAGAKP